MSVAKGFVTYRKNLYNQVRDTDKRLCFGVSMNEKEWFDFNVKRAVIGYRTRNTRLYKLLNRKLVKMAEVYAEMLVYLINIEEKGFRLGEYVEELKYLAGKMKKLNRRKRGIKITSHDKNGRMYLVVGKGKEGSVRYQITSKGDAQAYGIVIMRYCSDLVDCFPVSSDFRNYLKGYLVGELRKLAIQVSSAPYLVFSGVA